MRSFYFDMSAAVDVVTGQKPVTTKVGYYYDEHNTNYVLFVGTDRESGKILRDKNGNVRFNSRKNNWQKDKTHQAASDPQKLGEKLKSQLPVAGEVTVKMPAQEPTIDETSFDDLTEIPF